MDNNQITKHETWTRKLDFLICLIGLSIGFGNVWRFPYLCYKNGGGAFLIAYFSSAIFCGIPLVYIECLVGQMTRRSPYIVWKFCPILEGLGVGFLVVNIYMGIYLVQILSWAVYYMFASMINPLPWTYCDPSWATNKCLTNFSQVVYNSSYYTDPVNEYFRNHVLRLSSSIDHVGPLNFPLVGCLTLAYIIIFFVVWKGIRISGKVMYVTALLPFVMILILLGRSCSLKGALTGAKYYLSIDMSKLAKFEVWSDAGGQIFYSYGVASGVLSALASHNQIDTNVYYDSIRCSIVNSFCSIISGFVIFPVLGFMAERQNVSIDQVAESGPGLAFVAYPRALVELTGSNFWSFFFFLSLIFIGLDSAFITIETSVLSIEDILEGYIKTKYRKEVITLMLCLGSFLVGLSMVTNGGMYVFQIFNFFPISQILVLTGFLEIIALVWIYGFDRIQNDIKMLNLKSQGKILKFIFTVVTPVFTMAIFVMNTMLSTSVGYEGYYFPVWATVVGYLLTFTIVIPIVGTTIYNFYKLEENNLLKRILLLFKCKDLLSENILQLKRSECNKNLQTEL